MPPRGGCLPRPQARLPTCPGWIRDDDHPIVKLVEAGSHPDMRWLERLLNEKTGNLNRNIKVDQVRELGEFMAHDRRAIAVARGRHRHASTIWRPSGANALLKMLEEPPANTPVLPRQPCAGPAAADDPLAVPAAGFPEARR